jgi:hypothetical protein
MYKTYKVLIFLVLILVLFNTVLYAQVDSDEIRRCASMEYREMRLAGNPELEINLKKIEEYTQKWIRMNAYNVIHRKEIITIPVVVHIVYHTSEQNISDDQILSQLEVLNQDYRRLNSDAVNTPLFFQPVAADCQIEFCLAKRTPEDSASTGIIRKYTSVESFTLDNKVKFDSLGGSDAWDRDKYLNLWVCKMAGGVLGYASWPWDTPEVDGVVIRYQSFGRYGSAQPPYHLGRTCTHEVGHWLNLLHPWGNWGGCSDDDYVSDTPIQYGPNYYCPSYPQPSCSDTSDMFMNYMDYGDDSCLNIFTLGQKARMMAVIDSVRNPLRTSNGCQPVIGFKEISVINEIQIFPNPASGIININSCKPVTGNLELFVYDLLGNIILKMNLPVNTEINHQLDLSSRPSGVYLLRIEGAGQNRMEKIFIIRD